MLTRNRSLPYSIILLLWFFVVVLLGCGPGKTKSGSGLDFTGREPLDFPEITAGVGHTCMLTNSGRVECWGSNQFGQLGGDQGAFTLLAHSPDSSAQNHSSWVKTNVRGLPRKVTAIAAGFYHTCALDVNGGVYCWGLNNLGQLGDGTIIQRDKAVGVMGLESGVTLIEAGAMHTCALLENGGVKCWGDNSEGQLGNGTTLNSPKPVDVLNLPESIRQLSAGVVFTCALTQEGKLFCWGNGQNGRFGNKFVESYLTLIKVKDLKELLVVITAGDYHLCGRTDANDAICWGALSSELYFSPKNPVVVNGIPEGVALLVAGSGFTCSLTTTDNVKCWGDNYFGQLGNGTNLGSWDAVIAMNLTANVLRIGSGSAHACALLFDGDVLCWGDCSAGQCGDSSISWNWNIYTNHKYHFSLDYPPIFKVLEIPDTNFPSKIDQVLFARPDFQPSQSGARAEISMIITRENPSSKWESHYFTNYKKEWVQLKNTKAVKITGINMESQENEIVMIIQGEDYFIQSIPNNNPESFQFFDQVMYTFNIDF